MIPVNPSPTSITGRSKKVLRPKMHRHTWTSQSLRKKSAIHPSKNTSARHADIYMMRKKKGKNSLIFPVTGFVRYAVHPKKTLLKFNHKIIPMAKSLKGTRTEQNLLKAFAGESQARNRYEFFSRVASKEGYEQIGAIFQETANQEKEHAKRFFKFLEGGMVEITGEFPAGVIGKAAENLKAAAEGENYEWTSGYPEF